MSIVRCEELKKLARRWPKNCQYAGPGTQEPCRQQHDICDRVHEREVAAIEIELRRVAEEAQQQEFRCGGCGETMIRCAGPFAERVEKAESELSAAREQVREIVGYVQRWQPAGSPPATDALGLVRWIMGSMQEQVRRLQKAAEPFAERYTDLTNAMCHHGICSVEKCGRCGRVLRLRVALAETAQPCPDCGGEGYLMPGQRDCPKCLGSGKA